MTLNDFNSFLLIAAGVLALGTFAVFTSLRWWRWWSGRATWALWFAIIVSAGSFSLQENGVFPEEGIAETLTLGFLCAVLLFNLCVHIYKKWFWRPEHDAKHNPNHPAREVY